MEELLKSFTSSWIYQFLAYITTALWNAGPANGVIGRIFLLTAFYRSHKSGTPSEGNLIVITREIIHAITLSSAKM